MTVIKHSEQEQPGEASFVQLTLPHHGLSLREQRQDLEAGTEEDGGWC